MKTFVIFRWLVFGALCFAPLTSFTEAVAKNAQSLMVGVSKVDVTPTQPVVLAGYGGRTQPFEGIDTKLWARALVIGAEKPMVFVVLDNCGVPQSVTKQLAERLATHGIAKDRLMVAATHTHNAPSLLGYAPIVWAGRTSEAEKLAMVRYTLFAVEQMETAILQALNDRQPMSLEWGRGRVTFGGNRRVLEDASWRGFGLQRDGPVDHGLPVLAGRDRNGIVRFVWANYACHCTTVGSRNAVGGDWAGFANSEMETLFPDAIGLMSIGCGADVGPQPSGSLAIASDHGKAIAQEVQRVLAEETKKLNASPSVVTTSVKLPLEKPAGREHWVRELRSNTGFRQQLAKSMIDRIDKHGPLSDSVDYPISVCKFGNELAIVFLGGEVVVDYALRLSGELDWTRLWITAWTNSMPGYIPSRRILAEGGYEAEFSQVYYDHPTRYREDVENVLVNAIKGLVGTDFASMGSKPPGSMHQPDAGFRWEPDHQNQAFSVLKAWVEQKRLDGQSDPVLEHLRSLIVRTQPAVAVGSVRGGGTDRWNDFAGDKTERHYIRQKVRDAAISWKSGAVSTNKSGRHVFCFSGGMGWLTEPRTEGFVLTVDEKISVEFDVTRELTRWMSQDGRMEIIYLPTWKSDLDSGGFFIVSCRLEAEQGQDGVVFSVRSRGEGSKRWFAVDKHQGMPERLEKLRQALSQGAE